MADSFIEPYFAISESRLKEILRLLRLNHNYINYADVSEQVMRANPIPSPLSNSPVENNNPVPNSKELILLAETDWHNREERKRRYEMASWTAGWMTGFLSERKPYWPKVHEAAIRKDERKKVQEKADKAIERQKKSHIGASVAWFKGMSFAQDILASLCTKGDEPE